MTVGLNATAARNWWLYKIAKRDAWRCWICGEYILALPDPAGRDPLRPSVDHIVRRADGGRTTRRNLRLAHARCNSERHRPPHGTVRQ